MNISVFGGSQTKEGDAAYAEARELGALLAQRGHTVLTGGYIGTMEAVSRGAHEAGGRRKSVGERGAEEGNVDRAVACSYP